MADIIRLPITITSGDCFALQLSVGVPSVSVNVLLDTGSSSLTVNADPYHRDHDTAAITSKLLQSGSFSGVDFLAAIIRTHVGLPATAGAMNLTGANLGVIYQIKPSLFGNADGILGLAYRSLNSAIAMPADTWESGYGPTDLGRPELPIENLPTLVDQLVTAGLIVNKFAFSVGRSVTSAADPALNSGVFVLGGGEECIDLYSGNLGSVAVVHDAYYHTNLVAIQIDGRAIDVAPTLVGDPAVSNSIIDSGAGNLGLAPSLYQRVIDRFNAVDARFGDMLRVGIQDQTQLILANWPTIGFVFQGIGGAMTTVTMEPKDYWRFDSAGVGKATAALSAGGAPKPGQSLLGLPLFAGHFVVFDRTGGDGRSIIKFATRRPPDTAPLVA